MEWAAEQARALARDYATAAEQAVHCASRFRDDAEAVTGAWQSPGGRRFSQDFTAFADQLQPLVGGYAAAIDALRMLGDRANEIAADLRIREQRISGFDAELLGLNRNLAVADPDEARRLGYQRDELAGNMRALERQDDLQASWSSACRWCADALRSCAMAYGAVSAFPLDSPVLHTALAYSYANVLHGPPAVQESWTVTLTVEAIVVAGGVGDVVFEVRRLSNGTFEVRHLIGGGGVTEGGAEFRAGVRTGGDTLGIEAGATIKGALGVEAERTYRVASLDDVRLLVTNLSLEYLPVANAGLDLGNDIDGVFDKLTPKWTEKPTRWGIDLIDKIPGVPNIGDARLAAEDVAEYDAGTPTRTYTGMFVEGEADASARFGAAPTATTGGEVSAATGRSFGLVTTSTGLSGYRATVSGSVVAGWQDDSGTHGLDENGIVEIEWLLERGQLATVTATVTTFGRDTLTTRVTTFDLEDPAGRGAARRIVDAAWATTAAGPAAALVDLDALEFVTDDSGRPGVNQTVQEYSRSSSDYGVFFDIAAAAKVGVLANVDVTHLE